MPTCPCRTPHRARRIVLTGGPGAGKTAVLELVRQSFCAHVVVLPESAGIVFGGGFPRGRAVPIQRAAQRAIFFVQRELETAHEEIDAAVVVCDRGTVDGSAYWPGPDDLWRGVGTTLAEQLARYHAVIHLRVPPVDGGYDRSNPLRVESPAEAAAIDARIALAWAAHPHRFEIEPTPEFLSKASRVLAVLREQVPPCCREHGLPPTAGASHPGTRAGAPASRQP
jgi:predicted ATPase